MTLRNTVLSCVTENTTHLGKKSNSKTESKLYHPNLIAVFAFLFHSTHLCWNPRSRKGGLNISPGGSGCRSSPGAGGALCATAGGQTGLGREEGGEARGQHHTWVWGQRAQRRQGVWIYRQPVLARKGTVSLRGSKKGERRSCFLNALIRNKPLIRIGMSLVRWEGYL